VLKYNESWGILVKTIAMRLQGVSEDGEEVLDIMPTLRQMFADVGIELLESEDGMYNTFEIMNELGKLWNDPDSPLTQMQKANFAEQIGGKHQGAIVSAMLENWADAEGALKSAQDSMGSASREFNKYQESMEFRVNQLKNSMEELWIAFWDEEMMKDMISNLNTLVQSITWMIETFGSLTPIATSAFAMLLLFNKEVRQAFTVPAVSGGGVASEVAIIGNASAVATNKVKAFGLALGRAFVPLLAISAVTIVIEQIIKKFGEAKAERDEYIKSLKDSMVETQSFLKDMETFDLVEYEGLEAGARTGSLNNDEYERFLELQNTIISRYPELIDGYDKEGTAILRSADSLERYIALQKEKLHNDSLAVKNSILEDNNDGETNTWTAKINPFDTDFENIEQTLNDLSEFRDKITDFNNSINDLKIQGDDLFSPQTVSEFKQNKDEVIQEAQEFFTEFGRIKLEEEHADQLPYLMTGLSSNYYQGNFEVAKDYYQKIQRLIEENRVTLGKELSKLEGELSEGEQPFLDYLQATYDALKTGEDVTIEDIPLLDELNLAISENFDELDGTLVERADIMEELFNAIREKADQKDIEVGDMFKVENVDDTVDFLELLLKNMDLSKDEAKILTTILQKLRATATSQEEKGFDLEMWEQDTYDHYGKWIDDVEALDQAYSDLTEGQGLTLKGVYELIKEYPELAKHLEQQGDMLGFNAEGVKALQKIRSEAHKDALQQDKLELESALQKTKGQIGAMFQVGKAYEQLNVLSSKSIESFKNQRIAEYTASVKAMGNNLPMGREGYGEMVSEYTAELNRQFAPIQSMAEQLEALEYLMNSVGGAYSNPISSFPSKEKQEKDEKIEIYISNKYREELLKLNKALAEQQRIKARHGKFSKEYQKAIEREIEILKEKVKWTEAEKKSVQEQLRTGKYITYGTVDVEEAVSPTSNLTPTPSFSTASVGRGAYTGQYAGTINRYSSQYGLDPWLVQAVIQQESRFNRTAVSPAGARGLMQIMPATGRDLGLSGNEFFDATKNIEAGTRYLAQQIKAFGGNVSLGLAAYNAGAGNVRKYGGIPPFQETQNYVRKILANYGGGGGGGGYTGGGGGGNPVLQYGAKGDAVRELQKAIGVAVDGSFGPATLKAVKDFQRKMGIAVDGSVGPATWAKIGAQGGGGGYTAPAVSGGARPVLRYGARGDYVKELQKAIGVAVDGSFGPATLKAVKDFQKRMGIAIDGSVGPATWAKILGTTGGGGTPSTGSNVKSEAEQTLLDLELELTNQTTELENQIRELIVEVVNNSIISFIAESDKLVDDLAEADWNAELSANTDKRVDYLKEGLGFVEQQMAYNAKALETLWTEFNKRSSDMNSDTRHQLWDLIRDYEMKEIDFQKEVFNRTKEIIDAEVDKFEFEVGSRFQELETLLEDLQRQLDTLDLTENPKEYLEILKKQRNYQNEQRLIVASQISELEKMKKEYEGQTEILDYIDTKIKELTGTYKDMGDEIFDTNKQIEDAYKEFADNTLEIYKESLEKRKQGEIETINDVMEAERELHDEKMKQWDEELKQIDKLYSTQLEEMDKVEAERSYQAELEEMQVDRQKVVDELGLYAIDTTIEGKANKRRLEEELSEIDKQIAEHQRQRELELTREAIMNEQEERRENIERQKEEANEQLEESQENSQEQIDEIEKRYEEMLNDEEYFNQLREEMMKGHMETITQEFSNAVTSLGAFSEELGNNLTNNFINKLKEASEQMKIFAEEYTRITPVSEIGIGLNPQQVKENDPRYLKQMQYIKALELQQNITKKAGSPYASAMSKILSAQIERLRNEIQISFNIAKVENGVETANILYQEFVDNMRRRGVLV
jgi:hypothetical protein